MVVVRPSRLAHPISRQCLVRDRGLAPQDEGGFCHSSQELKCHAYSGLRENHASKSTVMTLVRPSRLAHPISRQCLVRGRGLAPQDEGGFCHSSQELKCHAYSGLLENHASKSTVVTLVRPSRLARRISRQYLVRDRGLAPQDEGGQRPVPTHSCCACLSEFGVTCTHRPHPEVRARTDGRRFARHSMGEPRRTHLFRLRNQMSSPGKLGQRFVCKGDHRFLFSARPTFQLPLARDCVSDPVIGLGEHQSYRSSARRITVDRQVVVLPNSGFDFLLGRPDVVGVVGTAQYVDGHFERHDFRFAKPRVRPSRLASRAPQDEGGLRASRQVLKHRRNGNWAKYGSNLPHPEVRALNNASRIRSASDGRASKDAR
jgi:hypothetical protein